jgi:hypothetical protein
MALQPFVAPCLFFSFVINFTETVGIINYLMLKLQVYELKFVDKD